MVNYCPQLVKGCGLADPWILTKQFCKLTFLCKHFCIALNYAKQMISLKSFCFHFKSKIVSFAILIKNVANTIELISLKLSTNTIEVTEKARDVVKSRWPRHSPLSRNHWNGSHSKAKSNLFDLDANQLQISRIIRKYRYQVKKLEKKCTAVPVQKKNRGTGHLCVIISRLNYPIPQTLCHLGIANIVLKSLPCFKLTLSINWWKV